MEMVETVEISQWNCKVICCHVGCLHIQHDISAENLDSCLSSEMTGDPGCVSIHQDIQLEQRHNVLQHDNWQSHTWQQAALW